MAIRRALLLLGLGLVLTAAACTSPTATAQPTPAQLTPTAVETPAPQLGLPSIAEAAQEVRPAVVLILARSITQNFFLQPVPQEGAGSGVIFDRQGYILTNNHVVEGATDLRVTLPDGRGFPAQIVGRDPVADLAVIKISGDDLPVARFGNTDSLRFGDWVIAIGNALDLPGGPTVTVGVVSALERSIVVPGGNV